MEGKPPGWYPDPEGEVTHLAYWDGEQWTGATAKVGQPPAPATRPRSTRWMAWVIGILVLGVVAIAGVTLAALQIAGQEASTVAAALEAEKADPVAPVYVTATEFSTLVDQCQKRLTGVNCSAMVYQMAHDFGCSTLAISSYIDRATDDGDQNNAILQSLVDEGGCVPGAEG